MLALTFPIGVGMGLAGALLPVAVKERFAHRPAFASGVYTTGINMGSALSSALAVPIAAAWGGWRAALVAFSVCTILFFAGWLFFTPGGREPVQSEPPPRLPWGRRVVWGSRPCSRCSRSSTTASCPGCRIPSRSAAGATSPPARCWQ